MNDVKVIAYITDGDRLLVFRHTDFPEAGIQVPGGSVEEGEALDVAVLREAEEETGLAALEIRSYLGQLAFDLSIYGLDQIQQRHFFHLVVTEAPPARWRHFEMNPSDGSPAPIEFAFFWARFPDEVPELAGDQGAMLPELVLVSPNRENSNE